MSGCPDAQQVHLDLDSASGLSTQLIQKHTYVCIYIYIYTLGDIGVYGYVCIYIYTHIGMYMIAAAL